MVCCFKNIIIIPYLCKQISGYVQYFDDMIVLGVLQIVVKPALFVMTHGVALVRGRCSI